MDRLTLTFLPLTAIGLCLMALGFNEMLIETGAKDALDMGVNLLGGFFI